MKSLDSDTLLYNLYLNIGSEEDPLPSDKPVDKDGSFIDFSKWDRGSDRIVPPLSVTIERVTDVTQDPETGNAVITYTDNNGRTQQIVSGNVNVGIGEDGSKQYNIDGMTFTTGEYQNQNQNQGQNNFTSGFGSGIGFGSGLDNNFGFGSGSNLGSDPELPYQNSRNITDEEKERIVRQSKTSVGDQGEILGDDILDEFRIEIINNVVKNEKDRKAVSIISFGLNDRINEALDSGSTYDKKYEVVLSELENIIGFYDEGKLDSRVGKVEGPTNLQNKYKFIEKRSNKLVNDFYKTLFLGSITSDPVVDVSGFQGNVISYFKRNMIFLKFFPTDTILEIASVLTFISELRENELSNRINIPELRKALQNFILLGQLRCYFISEIINETSVRYNAKMALEDDKSMEITLFDPHQNTIVIGDEAIGLAKLSLLHLIHKFFEYVNETLDFGEEYTQGETQEGKKPGEKIPNNEKNAENFNKKLLESTGDLKGKKEYVIREDIPGVERKDEVFFTRSSQQEKDLMGTKLPYNRTDEDEDSFGIIRKYLRVSTLLRMSVGSNYYHSHEEDPYFFVNTNGTKVDKESKDTFKIISNRVIPTYTQISNNQFTPHEYINNYNLLESETKVATDFANLKPLNKILRDSQKSDVDNLLKNSNPGLWFTSNKIYEVLLSKVGDSLGVTKEVFNEHYRNLTKERYNTSLNRVILNDDYAVYSENCRATRSLKSGPLTNSKNLELIVDGKKKGTIQINDKEDKVVDILRRSDYLVEFNMIETVSNTENEELDYNLKISNIGSNDYTLKIKKSDKEVDKENPINLQSTDTFKSKSNTVFRELFSKRNNKSLVEMYKKTTDVLDKYTNTNLTLNKAELLSYFEVLDIFSVTPEKAVYILSIFMLEQPLIAVGIRKELVMNETSSLDDIITTIFKYLVPSQIIDLYKKYLIIFNLLVNTNDGTDDHETKRKNALEKDELYKYNNNNSVSEATKEIINSLNKELTPLVKDYYIKDITQHKTLMGYTRVSLSVLYEFLRDVYITTLLKAESVYLSKNFIVGELKKLYDNNENFKEKIKLFKLDKKFKDENEISEEFEEIYRKLFVRAGFDIEDYKKGEHYLYPLTHEYANIFGTITSDSKLKYLVPKNKSFENEWIALEPMVGNIENKVITMNPAYFESNDYFGGDPKHDVLNKTSISAITDDNKLDDFVRNFYPIYIQKRGNMDVLGMSEAFKKFSDLEICLISLYLYLNGSSNFNTIKPSVGSGNSYDLGTFVKQILYYTRFPIEVNKKFSDISFSSFVPHISNQEFNMNAWNLYMFSLQYDSFRKVFETVRRDILYYILGKKTGNDDYGGGTSEEENLNSKIILKGAYIQMKNSEMKLLNTDEELNDTHRSLSELQEGNNLDITLYELKALSEKIKSADINNTVITNEVASLFEAQGQEFTIQFLEDSEVDISQINNDFNQLIEEAAKTALKTHRQNRTTGNNTVDKTIIQSESANIRRASAVSPGTLEKTSKKEGKSSGPRRRMLERRDSVSRRTSNSRSGSAGRTSMSRSRSRSRSRLGSAERTSWSGRSVSISPPRTVSRERGRRGSGASQGGGGVGSILRNAPPVPEGSPKKPQASRTKRTALPALPLPASSKKIKKPKKKL